MEDDFRQSAVVNGHMIMDFAKPKSKLRTAISLSSMAPIGFKLFHNAVQMIPDILYIAVWGFM